MLYPKIDEMAREDAKLKFRQAGMTPEMLLPADWKGLGVKTEKDLRNLGSENLMVLLGSTIGGGEIVSGYLDALLWGAEKKPVLAPFRRLYPPAAYLQSEVELNVLYLRIDTGRFAAGEYILDSEVNDGVVKIYSRIGMNGDYEPHIVHTCHPRDPFFMKAKEAEWLSTDADYRQLWLRAIALRMEAIGLETYQKEIRNENFDLDLLNTALVSYGYAMSNGRQPYDEFQSDGSVK